jgi:hypothetical protein
MSVQANLVEHREVKEVRLSCTPILQFYVQELYYCTWRITHTLSRSPVCNHFGGMYNFCVRLKG